MMKKDERYFFYWLTPDQFDDFLKEMKRRRLRPMPIKGVPCKGLNESAGLSYVAPEVWNKVCARQGSWYRQSKWRGQTLVISPGAPLPEWADNLSGVIMPSDFVPPAQADASVVRELSQSEEYKRREPAEWEEIDAKDIKYWNRLLRKTGADATLPELLAGHNANHANFITPRLYVETEGKKTPYSIGKTWQVCSVCVEMFNILGEEFERKYVMPCPGFCLYTKRDADRFYEILSGDAAREAAESASGEVAANGASANTE